jgi:hypothetical protein
MKMETSVKARRKPTFPSTVGAGRRLVVLTELVAGATRANAAAKAGISIRTLERWVAEHGFKLELETARRTAFDKGLGVLRGAVAKAVETLMALLDSKHESERRHAASEILSFAFRAHETGELEARLEALEKTADELAHRSGGGSFEP